MRKRRKRSLISLVCVTMVFILTMTGCKKREAAILPEVDISGMIVVTPISALAGLAVISAGSPILIEKGICWSASPSPTIEENKATPNGYPYFVVMIDGLVPLTKYYARAYAISEAGISYGDELSFVTPEDLSGEQGTVTDKDGNIYSTIGIGSQIWMAENLKTTRFNDSTSIPEVSDNMAWSNFLVTPAYCWYNNDEASGRNIYGALYNWFTVGTGKLCPAGWHVPDNTEWTVLATYLGGSKVAGGKMKVIGIQFWRQPNTGATNSSGFSGLPAGSRGYTGEFLWRGEDLTLWTSSFYNSESAS